MPEYTTLMPALVGSFSTPAGGNPTGAMVEAAFAHHDVIARYINCDVSARGLGDAVRGAIAMGWLGFNLSLPHKQEVIPLLDGLTPAAQLIGAVNCVVIGSSGLIGENTDGAGFVAAVSERIRLAGKRVVVFGAGGAARAIAVELALAGASSLLIVNRNRARGEEVAALVRENTGTHAQAMGWDGPTALPPETDVVVNATSVGLADGSAHELNVATETIHDHMLVCDVIPNPATTAFLVRARERGADTLDGRAMLVNQAAINVRLWTGIDVDRSVMRAALDRAIMQ